MDGRPEIVFCATSISYCLSRFFAMRSWAAVAAEAIVDWDSGGFSKPASSCASSSPTITVQSSCPELFFLTGSSGVYESFLRFILLERLSLDFELAPPLVAVTRKPRELLLPVALFTVAVFLSILLRLLEMVWVEKEPPPPLEPWCFSKCCYC